VTAAAEQASGIVQRRSVERLELSRRGEVLAQLAEEGEPRWIAVGERDERELDPAEDRDLPLASALPSLRRSQGAVLLAWKPGRRMVVRVQRPEAPERFTVLRGLRSGRFRQALERHMEGGRAARASGLVAAEVLDEDPETASFAMSWLGDVRVAVAAKNADSFARLGAALARFQRAESAVELVPHGVEDELRVLQDLAEKSVRLRGALPAGWDDARSRLVRALRSCPAAAAVRTHRDLHDGQLLETRAGLALLDFDLLARADEALDPANLLAHLELRVLQGQAELAGARACAEAFRAGFGRTSEPALEQRLKAWHGAALLRLSLVYHLRPPFAHLGAVLVERASARLSEAPRGDR
jgi:hypothetical protein